MRSALVAFELRRWVAAPAWLIVCALAGGWMFWSTKATAMPLYLPLFLIVPPVVGALAALGPVGGTALQGPWSYLASRGVARARLRWLGVASAFVAVGLGASLAFVGAKPAERTYGMSLEMARKTERLVAESGGHVLLHEEPVAWWTHTAPVKPPRRAQLEVPGAIGLIRCLTLALFLAGCLVFAPPSLRSSPTKWVAMAVVTTVFLLPVIAVLRTTWGITLDQHEHLQAPALGWLAWTVQHSVPLALATAIVLTAGAVASLAQWRRGDLP